MAKKTARATRPNAGVKAFYRAQLRALVSELDRSVQFWIGAAWRANTPELAQDASPAKQLQSAIRKLARRWQRNFDATGERLARQFAERTLSATDASMAAALKDAGFTVKFRMTASMNDAYQAVVAEQVGLIRSIASQHLTQVETIVMQGVQNGRDLGYIKEQLTKRYEISDRRADLIARDQSNKATGVITRTRQRDLGIKQGRWRHSGGGKEPRPEHVAANGKIFDLDKGMFLDGEWTWPGHEINCRCTYEPVIPGFDDED